MGFSSRSMGWERSFRAKRLRYQAVEQGIGLYNTRRPHGSLSNRIPAASAPGKSELSLAKIFSPLHPPAGCPATGTQAHDRSRELKFGRPAPVGATPVADHPSSRFADMISGHFRSAESDKFKSGLDRG